MAEPTVATRLSKIAAVAAQIGLFVAAWPLAFGVRFDLAPPPKYLMLLLATVGIAAAVKAVAFVALQLHRSWWRYASVKDLEGIVQASLAASGTMLILFYLLDPGEGLRLPRGVFVLDVVLSILLLGGLRMLGRVSRGRISGLLSREERRRIVIFGAGDSAEQLLREIDRNPSNNQIVEALFDDSTTKQGLRIHGVPVIGTTARFPDFAATRNIDEVIIATPSATGAQMKQMIGVCRDAGVPVRALPAMSDLLDGKVSWSKIRQVAIDDILGRQPIELDEAKLSAFLQDKTVLITGGGGSIGSELVRQVARWKPRRILALDQAENPVFDLLRGLRSEALTVPVIPIIANVRDAERVEGIFRDWKPHVVLHAAAHKHVPLMEQNVVEAVRNNVFGTRTVADAAGRHGATHFVMISTDKAVNPTSVMGTTKRLAELVVQEMTHAHEETRFVSVRFGNVLGSRGSVVPIFQEQIARGGPITVTHPDMLRYFMTIPEASQLVLEAATLGKGGEVFFLDMGEPVRIVDMARELIRLSGLKPDIDIEIVFTGTRPGEKLFEELALKGEEAANTHHPKVFVGNVRRLDPQTLADGLRALEEALEKQQGGIALGLLGELVTEAQLSAVPSLGSSSRRLAVVQGGRPE